MSDYTQSILNAFHDMLFVFSKDGVIDEYLTPNHEDELIETREKFLGKHHREVLPAHVSKKLKQAFTQIEQGQQQSKFDYAIERDGTTRWYVAVISKLSSREGSQYLGAVRNITERKNRELLIREVLNTSPAAIVVLRTLRDSEGNITDFEITHVNNLVEQLTEATEEQLMGQTLKDILPSKIEMVFEQYKSTIQTEKQASFEYYYENESGQTVWYLCKANKFKDGLVTSFLDITEQKETEKKLLTINNELKELNRQKDKLFSVISHDLKNTLAGTVGTYDLILEDYESLSKDEIVNYIQLLNEQTRNATSLLNELLLWSRNQFQDIKPEPEVVNVHDITTAVFDTVAPNAEKKGIHLKNAVPADLLVHADQNMVKTVLRNLLMNAVKFSHHDGEVAVEAEAEDKKVKVSVIDQGVGIEKEALDKIMDKKTTYTTRGTKGEKGSGLGLDLCIDFVEKHGGEIRAESEVGKGSTFTFTLPAQENDKR